VNRERKKAKTWLAKSSLTAERERRSFLQETEREVERDTEKARKK
jgi:hypothetical protein